MPAQKLAVDAQFPFLLWHLDLEDPAFDLALDALSEYERRKAASFAFERDRLRYRRTHAGLRLLLGDILNAPAAKIAIEEISLQKPFLLDFPRLSFSISHSGSHALVAISDDTEVGVDIEVIQEIRDKQGMAKTIFTTNEQSALALASPEDADRDFLQAWTRKEACVKAIGQGLSVPPNSFEVGIELDYKTVQIFTPQKLYRTGVQSFNVSPACSIAVAHVMP
ncbi:MAG: 4'-phosphopantetheinyl transferase family protein [Rhodoferax sp.]